MTTYVNSLEGGTDGVAISAGNSGGASGDAFATLPGLPSGATREYDSATIISGTMSAKVATDTTSGIVPLRWDITSTTAIYQRCYYQFSANPSAAVRIMMGIDNVTTRYSVQFLTDGKVRLLNSSGVTVHTTTNSMPLNAPFRLEVFADLTNGQATTRVFHGANVHGTTADEALGPTACTFGAAQVTKVDVGITVAAASVVAFWLDDIGTSDTGWLGPATTPQVLEPTTDSNV
jgi:hypothetical protein